MYGYGLDTNHLSAVLDTRARLRERIYQVRRRGVRFGTCVPILCELEIAIQRSRRRQANRRDLRRFLDLIRVWPLTEEIAQAYGAIYLELRKKGRALSQVDMMLAAMARVMDLTILTTDKDFAALPDIHAENWLA